MRSFYASPQLSNHIGLQDSRAVLAARGWLCATATALPAGAGPCQASQHRCSAEASHCRCAYERTFHYAICLVRYCSCLRMWRRPFLA